MSGKFASVVLAAAALLAAPFAMTWQQVIAASSWVIGVGSLLVAPAIGVMLADFWVTQSRSIQTTELFKVPPADWASDPECSTREDRYWYQGGVHVRAILAVLIGAAPNLLSLFSGLSTMLQSTGQMRLNLYVVNSEYSSLLGAHIAAIVYLLSFGVVGGFKNAKPVLIKFLIILVELPKRVTDAGALRAKKRLEAAKAKRDAANNSKDAQDWIDGWRVEAGLTAGPETVRALRTIETGAVGKAMELAERKRSTDSKRAMEIAMNKPDVVAARAAVAQAKKAAEQAVLRFEEAQMMADGAKRDTAVRSAEKLVTEKFTAKVAAEMAYESIVYKYTSTIVTSSTTTATKTSYNSQSTAVVEATEAKDEVLSRTDEARRERDRERAALEKEKARLARLAAEQKALQVEAAALAAQEKQRNAEIELQRRQQVEMEFTSESSSSSMISSSQKSSTMTSTTTSTTTSTDGSFKYEGGPVAGDSSYEYEGVPGYVVPLVLFALFTLAVVEGLGDVLHL
jgi:hypothetical protein